MRLLLSAFLLCAGPALAEGQSLGNGHDLYQQFCATCHGTDGRTPGAVGVDLAIPPADLTLLAYRNGGVFPTMQVVMRIDGRSEDVNHSVAMPIYGEFFEGEAAMIKSESGQPIVLSAPIADLVTFIEALQE